MKLLAPFDFSEASTNALKFGEEIALASEARLTVLHCLNIPHYPYSETETSKRFRQELLEKAELGIKNHLKVSLQKPELVEIEVVDGTASSAILKRSGADVQFTLMGYKEQHIPDKIGSTTRDVLRLMRGSVISVQREQALKSIENMLLVTDFRTNPSLSIDNVRLIQKLTDAQLTVLYVNSIGNWLTSKETYTRMDQFCQVHGLRDVSLEIVNDESVESGVINCLSRSKVDMIALKINVGDNKLRINETHVSAEKILDNTNSPLLTFAHTSAYD